MEYWYTASRVWVQWPDGRQAMVTYPQPTFTKPSMVDGWPEHKDPQAAPDTGTVTANGKLSVAGHPVSVGTERGGKPTQSKVEYWYTASRVWVQWPDGRQAMVTYPRPTFTKPSVVDGWPEHKDPQAAPGTGTVTARGGLSVAGHQVSVGREHGGKSAQGKVEYWYTESRVWVRWPDGRQAMATYLRPTLITPSVVDGWPEHKDPQAAPDTGTVKANGQLSVAGHQVSVGTVREGKPTQSKNVKYWYTASRVWVQWPDGRQAMATYPQLTLTKPSVVDGWPEHKDPQAAPDTGTVKANGQLSVAGHPVSVGTERGGKPTQSKVAYWYTESRVWVRWPDGRQAMVTYPQPTFTKPSVVDGWPEHKDPQAAPDTGTVTASGQLSVAGHPVSVGRERGGKPTQSKVEYWYTESRVWVRWPDGRQAMVTYPQPTLTKPSVVDGWPEHVDPQAAPDTGTVTASGRLSVAGQPVYVGRERGGESAQGKVEYWYTESRVWVRWPDGRQAMVTYPRPTLTTSSAGRGGDGPGGQAVSRPAVGGDAVMVEEAEEALAAAGGGDDEEMAGASPGDGPGWARARALWDLPARVRDAIAPAAVVSVRPGRDTVPIVGGRRLHHWFRLADPALVRRFRATIGPQVLAEVTSGPSRRLAAIQQFVTWLTEQVNLPPIQVTAAKPGPARDAVLQTGPDQHTLTIAPRLLTTPDTNRLLSTALHEVHHAEHHKLLTLIAGHATDEQLST
ncbi:hypothetical protein, partial [Micromonospora fulviviridis]